MGQFKDIRPYRDDEVEEVVNRLLGNPQLLDALGHIRHRGVPSCLRGLLRPFVGMYLRRQLKGVNDVRSLQMCIAPMLEMVIAKTTDNVTWSGLENLSSDKPCLLLSNHRDIVMDPALVNYVFYRQGLDTTRNAIGDNLLGRPYVADLMRLNKSFIVHRSLTGRKEKLIAFQRLSAYITDSITNGHNVWMAHREGRAKDGDDRTDPAILKMLFMSHKKEGRSFSEMVEMLNIIPVSISYEYDPCDARKAEELFQRQDNGDYDKEEDEDLRSIIRGIEGWKGRVHVSFGKPVDSSLDTPQAVVENIDQQMHQLYKLWPSNWLARDIAMKQDNMDQWKKNFSSEDLGALESTFKERLESCAGNARDWFLKIYANPVFNRN
ncbi:1-acyl-sn-glycerol-3-phosphate acyltransferase [Sansalvadorimonas sp. 2012CJ34-2]|uniref:1-acyl-sn-glycerol-3-phosphate acyltransferase n=1 Tax=Parendozoicomonas callyspongiae TaxID=2942213 RepID=A0ABT0PMQ3_9GAMM|nr:1-acyl-sn-glycerol-3-phosphate acyltransferase [Sansalvadorimonas sp. 2012CJ34-2]MCL6272017.1 1-acyl-sn-glycerol-3-phosphate acyltransferase [Sansalvadorimonas sp. 2012CJ34-2]